MFAIIEAAQWAQENFGRCDLGDKRRGARLVGIAGDLARNAGASLLKSCEGDEAAAEGLSDRLLRNAEVDPDAIAEGGFEATAQRARSCELLLAVEDRPSLACRHSVAEALVTTSSNPTSVNKGFIVHSVVLLDGCTGATVGPIEQRRWTRVADDYGKSSDRKRRAYEDKESFKWQQAGQAVRSRLGEALSERTTTVCDREAHISDYLLWQEAVGGRYVVRAAGDRRLCDTQHGLWDTLAQAPWLGVARDTNPSTRWSPGTVCAIVCACTEG